MKASVITVCFNEIDTITRTIDSVVNQTHHDLQYIVVDGNSTDGTADILRSYEQYIGTLVIEPDGGLYHAMNKALAHATGDFLYFLNADDYFYDPTVVASAASHFDSDPALDILSGRVEFFNTPFIHGKPYKRTCFRFDNKLQLYKRPISQQCIFAHARLFDTVGRFDTRYRLCADYDWLIRAINQKSRLQFVDEYFAYMDYSGRSFTEKALRIREKRQIILRNSTARELLLFFVGGLKQFAARPFHGSR